MTENRSKWSPKSNGCVRRKFPSDGQAFMTGGEAVHTNDNMDQVGNVLIQATLRVNATEAE